MAHQPDASTSRTLLGRLRLEPRDQAAWSDFVQRYGRMVSGWCRHWGLDTQDADDVTQNVLLQLSRQMKRFEYDGDGSFRGWLKTVAYRAWCDFLEQRTRRNDKASGDTAVMQFLNSIAARDEFLQQMEAEWQRELLHEAMCRVRPRVQAHTWEAFRLMTQEKMAGQQVADQLGMKVGAVWVAKSKVQKMLHREIQLLQELEEAQMRAP